MPQPVITVPTSTATVDDASPPASNLVATPGTPAASDAASDAAATPSKPVAPTPPPFFHRPSGLLMSRPVESPPTNLGALLAVALSGAAVSAITTATLFIKWVRRFKPPELHYMPTPENEALVHALPLLHRSYVPNLLAWNAHLAGVFGYMKLPGRPPSCREMVTLPDGGTVRLSWQAPPQDDGRRVIVLFPGINNDASMPYVRHLSLLLDSEGLGHVCAVDWRVRLPALDPSTSG